MLLLYMIGELLPNAMSNIWLGWEEEHGRGNLEAYLAALLEQNESNVTAKDKLRFRKFMRVLTSDTAPWRIAAMVVSLDFIETIIFDILSHRVTLAAMLDEQSGCVAKCMQRFLDILDDFSPDSEEWLILAAVGADFRADNVRRFVRAFALQLNAGMEDHFVQRFSHHHHHHQHYLIALP